MPLKKCSDNKKSGWKWGDEGKCYTGKDSKKKAIKQGIAIEGPREFQKMASSFTEPFTHKDVVYATECMCDLNINPSLIVATSVALKSLAKKNGQ